MCWHMLFCNLFFISIGLVNQSSINSDSLAQTFCKYFLTYRIDQLKF